MFHLGWFTNYMPPAWNRPWAGQAGRQWQNGEFYVDLARALERGCFDYLLLEDSTYVSNTFAGTFELDLTEMVRAPKHDPMPLAAVLARETRHLGLIPTANISFYPPFLLARLMSTLDHLSDGRIGWNVVTGAAGQARSNYGLDADDLGHDERYDLAEEFVDLVRQLWDSWDADAVVADHASDTYIDHTKVHTVDFVGKHYSSRGPLNTVPSPQQRPVICQAGGSSRGRRFAALNAETVVALPKGIEAMKAYVADIREIRRTAGLDPDGCKVMYIVSPVIAETTEDAEAIRDRARAQSDARVSKRLALMSGGDVDWSRFDLDQPLPDLPDEDQSIYQTFRRMSEGKTFRQALADDQTESVDLVGTVDSIASEMADIIDETGGDGFLFYSGSGLITRRYVTEVVDGLVAELQQRGLTRDRYEHDTLRAHLQQF